MAWLASHFIAALTGKSMSPRELLGRPLRYVKEPKPEGVAKEIARFLQGPASR